MKPRRNRSARTVVSTLLCLAVLATASFAAPKPISYPRGLAVDAKGNLYVANSGGNNILMYNANYGQVTAKTITQGISNPYGVALDPYGSLWVANYGTSNGGPNGSISEYTNGQQVTGASITNGILGPQQIAIDGLGDIWVQNDYINLNVYDQFGELVTTVAPINGSIYGLATSKGWVATGQGGNITYFFHLTPLVAGQQSALSGNPTAYAMAGDDKGNFYFADSSNYIHVAYLAQSVVQTFAYVGFQVSGLALDNIRGRLYVADFNANQILVYSTANGSFLHTIQ